jgi:hypothetical protein
VVGAARIEDLRPAEHDRTRKTSVPGRCSA